MDEMAWYVVQTLSGQENRARDALQVRIQQEGMEDLFGEIVVPQEQVIETRNGQKRKVNRKSYPGYMFIQMDMSMESAGLVLDTPKITQFLGAPKGKIPPPMSPAEVERLLQRNSEQAEKARPAVNYSKGEKVTINEGPLTGMTGSVDEVRPEKGSLYVLLTVFGRSTRVELELGQVQKA